jgi:hypothetical protein
MKKKVSDGRKNNGGRVKALVASPVFLTKLRMNFVNMFGSTQPRRLIFLLQ